MVIVISAIYTVRRDACLMSSGGYSALCVSPRWKFSFMGVCQLRLLGYGLLQVIETMSGRVQLYDKRRLRAVCTARSLAFMLFVDMACCHVCEGHGWKPLSLLVVGEDPDGTGRLKRSDWLSRR